MMESRRKVGRPEERRDEQTKFSHIYLWHLSKQVTGGTSSGIFFFLACHLPPPVVVVVVGEAIHRAHRTINRIIESD